MRKNLLLMLALLLSAVTTAWAQTFYTANVKSNNNVTFTVADEEQEGFFTQFTLLKNTAVIATPKEGYAFRNFNVKKEGTTLYNGSVTNDMVPIYGYTNYFQKCEYIMPKADLVDLKDKNISSMKFYSTSKERFWNKTKFKIFVKEVEAAAISDFVGDEGATIVYEGFLSIVDNGMIVNFAAPYNYKGGNLLIGIYQEIKGNEYNWVDFYGAESEGSCVEGFDYSSFDDIEAEQKNFLPKTTFFTDEDEVEVTEGEDGSYAFAMPAADVSVSYSVARDITYKVKGELEEDVFYTNGKATYTIGNWGLETEFADSFDDEENPYEFWMNPTIEDAEGNLVAYGDIPAGKYEAVFTNQGYAGEIRLPFEVIENYLINNDWNDNIVFKAGDVEANAEDGWPIIQKGDKISATPKEGYTFTKFSVIPDDYDLRFGNWGANSALIPYSIEHVKAYQKSEFILPAASLAELKDKKISMLRFQTGSSGGGFWKLTAKVFLKEVEEATLTTFTGLDGATVVCEGTFDDRMRIKFDAPYEYKGGNLLIGIYVTEPVPENEWVWEDTNFSGENLDGASINGYSEEGLDDITEGTLANFAPMTYFYTEDGMADVAEGEDGSRSFTMPAANQKIEYQVCRDLSVKVIAEFNDFDPYLYGGGSQELPGVKVYDALNADEETDPEEIASWRYTVKYYDAEGNELEKWNYYGAGKYTAVITGNNNDGLEGEIILPFEFINAWYAGNVAAGEYATYFKDANLKVAPEQAEQGVEIYAITEVGETAVTVEKVDVISANTPMLVFNGGDGANWPLLIETDEDADEVESAPEFKGSLAGEKFTLDEVNEFNFYIFNGVDFVKVNTAGSIAANRCWLQVAKNSAAAAPRITIGVADFGLTGIDVAKAAENDGQIYDMQGRKVSNAKKGLYIMNGKKVIIK